MRSFPPLPLLAAAALTALASVPAGAQEFVPAAPGEGEEVTALRPAITFTTHLPGDFDRSRIRLLLDADDLTEFLSWKTGEVRAMPPLPVAGGDHLVQILRRGADGKEEAIARIAFRAVPPRRRTLTTGRLADAPSLSKASRGQATLALAPHADGAVAGAAGEASYSATWVETLPLSGKRPPAALPDALVHYFRGPLSATAGVTAAAAFDDSRFLGLRSPRQALEAFWDEASLGQLEAFSNFLDRPQGSGGERSFRQDLRGASWQRTLGPWLTLHLLGETAGDRAGSDRAGASALSRPERADLLGALLGFRLGGGWEGHAEIGRSDRNVNEGSLTTSATDSALRLDLAGALGGNAVKLELSRVGPRYGNPGDPSVLRDREAASLEVSRTEPGWNYGAYASGSRDALGGSLPRSDALLYGLAGGYRLPGQVGAQLSWEQQTVSGRLATTDQRTATAALSRTWGGLTIDLNGARTTTAGPAPGSRASSASGQAHAQLASNAWGLTASAGLVELRQDGARTRLRTLFIQPSRKLHGDRLLLVVDLGADATDMPGRPQSEGLHAKGSATWTLPQGWRGANLTAQLGWQRLDGVRSRSYALQLGFSPTWSYRR